MSSPDIIARVAALDDEVIERLDAGDPEVAAKAEAAAIALLDEHRLTRAAFDADARLWTFGHRVPGPAGGASVRIAGGALITFDLADSDRLIAVSVGRSESAA